MSLVSFPSDLYYPNAFAFPMVSSGAGYNPSFATNLMIDATGEKASYCGRVVWPSRTGSKTITRVQLRWGAVTKAGGSALTLSLQDVSLTAGPPMQGDGVADQTVAIPNAHANFASNTWYRSDALSSGGRAVNHGDLVAVVVEYDGAGRLGADTVTLSGLSINSIPSNRQQLAANLYAAAWGGQSVHPVIVLEFSDGSYGTLHGAVPYTGVGTSAFQAASSPDETALKFQVPVPCKVDSLMALAAFSGSTSEMTLSLYDSTSTLLASVALDPQAVNIHSTAFRWVEAPISEITLAANTTYYFSIRATSGFIQTFYVDVADSAFFALTGASLATWATRTDLGAWTETTTRRPLAAVRISALDDGNASAGGVYTRGVQVVGL